EVQKNVPSNPARRIASSVKSGDCSRRVSARYSHNNSGCGPRLTQVSPETGGSGKTIDPPRETTTHRRTSSFTFPRVIPLKGGGAFGFSGNLKTKNLPPVIQM